MRGLVALAVALVVLIVVGVGLVFGVPGTGFRGLLGAKQAPTTSGVNTDPSQAAIDVPASFANGYSQAWTVTLDDLGVYQDFASMGITGYSDNVPSLMEIASSSSIAILQSTFANGTISSNSSIFYGVDLATGQKKWSTGDSAGGAANCTTTMIAGKLFCVDGAGGGIGSGLHLFTIDSASGRVGPLSLGLFEPDNYGQTNGQEIPLALGEGEGGDWVAYGSGWGVSVSVSGGDLFARVQGANCNDLVSRIDPSSLKAMWTVNLQRLDGYTGCDYSVDHSAMTVQGGVLIAGALVPSALDLATGKVLCQGVVGFSGAGTIFAINWTTGGQIPGASDFTDSTGSKWQVAWVDVGTDAALVDFHASRFGLPLILGEGGLTTSFYLGGLGSSGPQWNTPSFSFTDDLVSGVFDGQRLLVSSASGNTYYIDPATGSFLWQGTVPVSQGFVLSSSSRPSDVAFIDDSTALVQKSLSDGQCCTASAIDLATGNVVWTFPNSRTTGYRDGTGSSPGLFVEVGRPSVIGAASVTYITPQAPQSRVDGMPKEIASCPNGWTPVSWSTWQGTTPGHTLVCSTPGKATYFVLVFIGGATYWSSEGTALPTGGYTATFGDSSCTIALGGGVTFWDSNGRTTSYVAPSSWDDGHSTGFSTAPTSSIPACPSGSYPISLSTWGGQWLLTCGTSSDVVTVFIYYDGNAQHNGGTMTSQGGKLCGNDDAGAQICQTAAGVSVGSQFFPTESSWMPGYGQTNTQSNPGVTPPTTDGYSNYFNPRFNFGVDYPNALNANPSSANGDGQSWTSPDGQITFIVWGENVVNQDPAGVVDANTAYAAQGMTLTYSTDGTTANGSKWMVKSGWSADGSTSFYCFSTAGPGSAVTISWVWPTSQTYVKDWIDHAYASLVVDGVATVH